MQFLADIGIDSWVDDEVTAEIIEMNSFFGRRRTRNTAKLSFNYSALSGNELEVLTYERGPNWMKGRTPRASHIGMHCTAEELTEWREFMAKRDIRVAQEVETVHHTNPAIANKRRYNYVVFDTAWLIGVDLKFIVRILSEGEAADV